VFGRNGDLSPVDRAESPLSEGIGQGLPDAGRDFVDHQIALELQPDRVGSWQRLVPQLWFLDPAPRTLEVFRLDGDGWRLAMTAAGDTAVRAEPFDAVEIDLAALWAR
jgi:hypothetical protein